MRGLCFVFLFACAAEQTETQVPTAKPLHNRTGGVCKYDQECVTGEVCDDLAGKCAPTCSRRDDCPYKQICLDREGKKYCATGSKPACLKDDECAEGQICNIDGVCAVPHCPEDPCPFNYYCVGSSCVASGPGLRCDTGADCSAYRGCKDDRCSCTAARCTLKLGMNPPNPGAQCTLQTAWEICGSAEYCNLGKCASSVACSEDAGCTAGLLCLGGYCKTPLDCRGASDCDVLPGFTCRGGLCLTDDTGRRCEVDTECRAGFYCRDQGGPLKACAPGCRADADCPRGLSCDLFGTRQCVEPVSQQGAPCLSDQDCSPGCEPSWLGSAKVCDYSVQDYLAGRTHGVCRDRCNKLLALTGLAGCIDGKECESVDFYMTLSDRHAYCGASPLYRLVGFGGYSACR